MESEKDRKIRERAYELWVQGGRSEGSSEQHWFQAEQEYAAGSESPDASAPAGSTAETVATPVKKTTRARSAASAGEAAPKPAAARAGAKRTTSKAGTKSDAAKAVAPER
jgi:hypothetical protein